MTELICYTLLLIGFIALVSEVKSIIRYRTIRAFNLFFMMYIMTYFFTSAYFLNAVGNEPSDLDFLVGKTDVFVIWAISSIISFVILKNVIRPNEINGIRPANVLYNQSTKELACIQLTAIASLLVGIVSMYLWSAAYGGILNLIMVADLVRAGHGGVTNPLAFFMRPAFILLFSTLLFIPLIQCKKNKFLNLILFVVSFCATILFLLAADGRFLAAMFFAIVFFSIFRIFDYGKITVRMLLNIGILSVAALVLISLMDSITYLIRNNDVLEQSDDNFFIREFSYIYRSGVHATNLCLSGESPWLILHDIGYALFAWVPTSMKPSEIINIWDYNTFELGHGYSAGQVPTDFVTTALYDLSFLGIVVVPIFWGKIIRWIEIKRAGSNSMFIDCIYYFLAYSFIRLPNYTMLYDPVIMMFPVFISWLIWIISKRFIQ